MLPHHISNMSERLRLHHNNNHSVCGYLECAAVKVAILPAFPYAYLRIEKRTTFSVDEKKQGKCVAFFSSLTLLPA